MIANPPRQECAKGVALEDQNSNALEHMLSNLRFRLQALNFKLQSHWTALNV